MAKLRDPENGCPWDVKQDFKSLARYTIEEAYEVVEAIENSDHEHLCEELGDLLLQIVFHAQIATEQSLFSFDDVAAREAEKMIDRHPHVFGDRVGVDSAADVLRNWEVDKAAKKAAKASGDKPHGVLDDVNTALPAMSRGLKLQQRAARVGFDWGNPTDIIAKIREETDELEAELAQGKTNADKIEDELGDLYFAMINLARHLDIDPERALRRTNGKFEHRFKHIENALRQRGQPIADASLDEMENLWQEAKKGE
jgi:ATP diphosphatase